jgi:AcrR family transcriptional regulator
VRPEPSADGKKPDGRRVRRDLTEKKILATVGKLIAKRGLDALGVNAVAKAARVDKVLIYRYFGDLDGLLRRYGESADFWPDLDEVLGAEREVLREPSAAQIASRILVNYARALRRRPATLQLLAWECCHRNELTIVLEETRERWSARLIEEIRSAGIPLSAEMMMLAGLLSAAINYLTMRGQQIRVFGGMDVHSDEGWSAIESAIGAAFSGLGARDRRT